MKSFDDWIEAETELTYEEWLAFVEQEEKKRKPLPGAWTTLLAPGLRDFIDQRTGINEIHLPRE